MKKAFTLIELILVIVILGIVGLMSFEMLLNVYKNYAQSRAINLLETRTELALEQISKRLSYRIKESAIARQSASINNVLALSDGNINASYDILEFIPYAYEAYNAGIYSGVVDLVASDPTANRLVTPGSTLSSGDSMLADLMGLNNFDFATQDAIAVIFKGIAYDPITSFGFINANNLDIAVGRRANDTALALQNFDGNQVSEQYHLAYTAYALVPSANAAVGGDFTLNLHYNYRPWLGQRHDDPSASVEPIAQNVTQFNFTEQNGMVVLKLCLRDGGGDGRSNFVICKTKAVY